MLAVVGGGYGSGVRVAGLGDRVDRNLELIQRLAVAGALLGALSNVATGGGPGTTVLLGGAALVGVSMWMHRRGWRRPSAMVLLAALLALVHALAVLGEGIHDVAIALYPVLVLAAALLLDPALLVGATVGSLVSVVLLAWAVAPLEPWSHVTRAFLDLSIIIVVTAIGVHRLVKDVARGVAVARAHQLSLERAYGELERFTYVASHDLKSPLVTIRGFLDYVERDAVAGNTARVAEDMQRIRAATDRMGRLLDDLLELSRTGRIDRPSERLGFGDVVREAWSLAEGRLAARGVEVVVEEAAESRSVAGDRARLVGLVQNLLDNAARFMGNQEQPRVVLGVREPSDPRDPPVFFVRDNGMGIAPEHHERVFELFHRLDPRGEGTGLGLALARRIVETHGGRLWVESDGDGQGSTFLFTLPGGSPGRSVL